MVLNSPNILPHSCSPSLPVLSKPSKKRQACHFFLVSSYPRIPPPTWLAGRSRDTMEALRSVLCLRCPMWSVCIFPGSSQLIYAHGPAVDGVLIYRWDCGNTKYEWSFLSCLSTCTWSGVVCVQRMAIPYTYAVPRSCACTCAFMQVMNTHIHTYVLHYRLVNQLQIKQIVI